MTPDVLAAGTAAAAAALLVVDGPVPGRFRLPPAPRRSAWPWPGLAPRLRPRWVATTAWVVGSLVVLSGPTPLSAGCLLLAAGAWLARMRQARARRALASATSAAVAEVATALAADLVAGHAPLSALAGVAAEPGADGPLADRMRSVVAVGRLGGDVPLALRAGSVAVPGADSLRDVAAAWQVAEQTGAPLSAVLDQVAAGIVRRRAAERRLEVSLASARSTARLLVALPGCGLLIGAGLGVSPAGFLFGPLPGRLCLVAGIALAATGLVWTDQIAGRALAGVRAGAR